MRLLQERCCKQLSKPAPKRMALVIVKYDVVKGFLRFVGGGYLLLPPQDKSSVKKVDMTNLFLERNYSRERPQSTERQILKLQHLQFNEHEDRSSDGRAFEQQEQKRLRTCAHWIPLRTLSDEHSASDFVGLFVSGPFRLESFCP